MSIHKLKIGEVPQAHFTNRWSTLYMKLMSSNRWAAEPKKPGQRCFCITHRDGVSYVLRNGDTHPWDSYISKQIPMDKLPIHTILDGTIETDFGCLFRVFDILWSSGADVRSVKYRRRKAIVSRLFNANKFGPRVVTVPGGISGQAKAGVFSCLKEDDTGVVFKHITAPYPRQSKDGARTRSWISCEFDTER